jgi:predicted RNA-binding protein with TRAM domain
VPVDHFKVRQEGKLVDIAPKSPVEEGAEIRLELVEVGEHDMAAGVGKLDGLAIVVADAAQMVGKKAKVRVERVLNGVGYATLVQSATKKADVPITAESEAEKPTRAPRKKAAEEPKAEAKQPGQRKNKVAEEPKAEAETVDAVAEEPEPDEAAAEEPPKPKKKTRRGSRGGRNRKKKPAAAAAAANGQGEEPVAAAAAENGQGAEPVAAAATIHVPSPDLGQDGEAEASADGEQPAAAPKKKRTRRGSRGGRNRRKKSTASAEGKTETSGA